MYATGLCSSLVWLPQQCPTLLFSFLHDRRRQDWDRFLSTRRIISSLGVSTTPLHSSSRSARRHREMFVGAYLRQIPLFGCYFPPPLPRSTFWTWHSLVPARYFDKRRGPRTSRLRDQEPPNYLGVAITTVINYYRSTAILGVFNQPAVPISGLC